MRQLALSAALILIPIAAMAEDPSRPTNPTAPCTVCGYTPPPKGFCVFHDRLYSPGAYLCVAKGTVGKCNGDGTRWDNDNSPTCQEANTAPAR